MESDPSGGDHLPHQCGRLLAHLDLIRRTMDGSSAIGTTCFQAAAAMPAPVLGSLLGLSWRDLGMIRQYPGRPGRAADRLERHLAALLDGLGGPLPESLDRSEQGAFAIGFYQERALARSLTDAAERPGIGPTQDAVLRESPIDGGSAVPDDF